LIYGDSRYANGIIFKANDARTTKMQLTVTRTFPNTEAMYYTYVWTAGDRIDIIAQRIFGNSNSWHLIMDYNPEILDGFNIPPGTSVRIPNG
jgi:hypothetical protein